MPDDMTSPLRGQQLLRDPARNKSTAFTPDERERFGLRGLLPAASLTQELQVERVLENFRRKETDLERYIFLLALQARNERLFYRTLLDHVEETMPIVYTPTVGQACREFSHIFRGTRGLYLTPDDRGEIRRLLDNWAEKDIRVIVITDGERILGLGDLGANGMGIPIGKLALYTALAGVAPHHCLPVLLDVGTNNDALRTDPLYLGLNRSRLRGPEYDTLVDEFVDAVQDAYPQALIQFEDFITPNAYRLLQRYRERVLCFNDDIQGTAAVVLAGLYAAARVTGRPLSDTTFMFLGAGSAASGVADLVVTALTGDGMSLADARGRIWVVDSKGLVVRGRETFKPRIESYAQDRPAMSFHEALAAARPHVLVGATAQPGIFDEDVIRLMSKVNNRPVIFALSNPTSRSECTAEQAYRWSDGRVVFASGSPFPAMATADGRWCPGQANNAYVFPGIGLGAIGCQASAVTDGMFLAAARALADAVEPSDLEQGTLFPSLKKIRQVSLTIATAVAETAYTEAVARAPRPDSIADHLADVMYQPAY